MPARMHDGGGAEERLVLGHGVVDARADGHLGAHGGNQAQGHQRRESARHARAEKVGGGKLAHGGNALHLFERRGVDVDQVQAHICRRHDGRTGGQRHGQRALGPPHFFRHVGGGVPAAVPEHHPQQADEELGRQADRGRADRGLRKVAPASTAGAEAQQHEGHDHQQFGGGEHVLHLGGAAQTEAVQHGERGNQAGCQQLSAAQAQRKGAGAEGHGRARELQAGGKVAQVIRKCERRHGNGRRKACEKRDPSGHEAPLRTESMGQIDILTAGTREIDPQFGVAQRAGEREQRAHAPARQYQAGVPQVPSHVPGGGEDARSHHVGNHEGSRAEEAKLTEQRRRGSLLLESGHV